MKNSVLDEFKSCSLFKEMTDDELTLLGRLFHEKKMEEGTTVFIENMPGESLYLIRQGTIKISKMIAEGDEKTLIILGPEDVFGEMAILDGAPRSATARVMEKAHLLRIKKGDFDKLCESQPRLGIKLMRNIIRLFSQRIRENNDEYKEMLIWALAKQA